MSIRAPSIGLRSRVTIVFGALALAVSVILALGTYLTARHYLVGQREQTAARQAFADASFVRDGLLTSGAAIDDVLAATSPPPGALLVVHRSGQWYSSSLSAGQDAVPPDLRALVGDGHAGTSWGRLSGDPVVAVGTPLPAVQAQFFEIAPATELASTLRTLGLALAAFAALTTVGGTLIGRAAARRVVAPLDGIASATARIAGGDIATRLSATQDPDLTVIVGSFNAMVEALQERLDRDARFAADVSHELRSPVTAMATAIDVLERTADDPRRREQSMALLGREVQRLHHALEQLLELGRLEAGVDAPDHQLIDLGELVAATLVRTHRPVSLLDRRDGPVWVSGDKNALHRTVVNLLDNADSHAGGVTRVRLHHEAGAALLSVDDSGPGVPLEERQRVFERFARSGSRASRPGTGLGLSLVAETVRAHGGDVWCGDAPGGGARFVIRLPLVDPVVADQEET
jgi:signal transduction histidine kinase